LGAISLRRGIFDEKNKQTYLKPWQGHAYKYVGVFGGFAKAENHCSKHTKVIFRVKGRLLIRKYL